MLLRDCMEFKAVMAELHHLRARVEWLEGQAQSAPPLQWMPPSTMNRGSVQGLKSPSGYPVFGETEHPDVVSVLRATSAQLPTAS